MKSSKPGTPSRREFLRISAAGAATVGLALPEWFRASAHAAPANNDRPIQGADESPALAAVSSLTAVWNSPPPAFPNNFQELARAWSSTGAPLLGNGEMAACFGNPADKLCFFINRNDFWRMTNGSEGSQKLVAILDLTIVGLKGATYRLDQTIRDGVVSGVFTQGSLTVRLTCWLAATEDLLVIELGAEGGETPVQLGLTAPGAPPSKTASGATGATAWIVRKFTEQVVISTEAATVLRVFGADGLSFTLKPGVPVTLAIVSASAFQQAQPLEKAQKHVAALTAAEIARVRVSHNEWWARYWNRSWVEIGDPLLMKGYYQGLYTLAACSRNPRFPPGIFGPWITCDWPGWSNDYHLNEMLCMSVGHVLRLVPVWPKNKDAAFVNLRTWGAFLVSARLKDGVVQGVRLVSEKGRDCTVVNPWPGRPVTLIRNGRKAETLAGERLSFKSAAGEAIIFHTPKKLADGTVKPGSFTVLHNGVLIQDHIPVGGEPTTAAPLQGLVEKGPLYLQDHGNPVRYRNVWIRPL